MIKAEYDKMVEPYSERGRFRIANLMAHGYNVERVMSDAVIVTRSDSKYIIFHNGDYYKMTLMLG